MKAIRVSIRTAIFFLLGTVVFPVLGNIVASLLQESLGHQARFAVVIIFVLIGVVLLGFELWEQMRTHTGDQRVELERRNRQAMLHKVQAIWVQGVLQKSLYREILIEYDLTEELYAVERPTDVLIQRDDGEAQPLPQGTRIVEVFDKLDYALLILGAPGAGKTTLLLELTQELLERAAKDDAQPIPVVFPLSSWAETRRPLAEWLVEELSKRYSVSRSIGRPWVAENQILPLLDGLDEVKEEFRDACVEAINLFRRERGLLPVAVCSRLVDYEGLTRKLRLHGAVVVQPLTRRRVYDYLDRVGEPLAGVRAALAGDPSLWELLDTPLMLNIMTMAYAGKSAASLHRSGTVEELRNQLFVSYVERMFQRRAADTSYTPEQTVEWLSWLAWQMKRHSQTVFYVEQIQPDWLPRGQAWIPRKGIASVLALSVGFLLTLSVPWELALLMAITIMLIGISKNIETVEKIRWSWAELRTGIPGGLIGGLITSMIVMLIGIRAYGVAWGIRLGAGGFVGGIIGAAFLSALVSGEIESKTVPNQGIRYSIRNAIIFGPLVGLVGGIPTAIFSMSIGGIFGGLLSGSVTWILLSLLSVLTLGGRTFLQHYIIRFLFKQNGTAPWRYVHFLNYAAGRIFLRKVGGGYIFIHRWLLEYFAAQYGRRDGDATTRPAATSPAPTII